MYGVIRMVGADGVAARLLILVFLILVDFASKLVKIIFPLFAF